MKGKKNIFITDDHPLLIEGLSAVINSDAELTVSATANDSKELIQKLDLKQPDLLILDINLPGRDGIETAKIVGRAYPEVYILCISSYFSPSLIAILKGISVDGFIPKQTDSKQVIDVVKRIIAGEKIFIKSEVENHYGKQEIKELELLTQREKEVIRLIKKGKSSKEIAEALFLSSHTIDTHRKNICAKLNLTSPGALTRFAMEKDI